MANLKFRTADSMNTRELPDNSKTMEYIYKLSYAAIVTVHFDHGTWQEIECGKVINKGKIYNLQAHLERIHLHIRAAHNHAEFYGKEYANFKAYTWDSYNDALTILETISRQNGGTLGQ